ncbi:MAG: penicillin-binding protein 2 [Gammaproteobacteria bacterium]
MPIKFTFKDLGEETRLIKGRVFAAVGIIVLLISLIILRVFYLQVIMHDHFTTLSEHNRIKILPVSPIRGLIFSRDGVVLAENQPSFSLEIIPEREIDLNKAIKQVANIIPVQDEDIKRFYKLLKEKRRDESVPLRFNLSEGEIARFSVNHHLFSGVDVIARPHRRYPLGAETAHAIGYVARISEADLSNLDESNYVGTTHTGKLGVEKAYETLLHGRVGYQQVEVNAQGRIIREIDITKPEPGKNIYLTLDVSLQKIAVEALQNKRGAIVAIDPNNGDVLALVSSPSYDPNPFVNGIDVKSYQALLQSKDKPLINRALQGTYPPGSTIKPFLSVAALAYGVRQLTDEIWCPGWYSLKGSKHQYRDWKKQGHGRINLRKAITQSCDVYYYALAHDMGIERISKILLDFGFGKKTQIDIRGEALGLVPSKEWKRETHNQPWFPGETLITGIGQGSILATPLQIAAATSALANQGKSFSPRLAVNAKNPITDAVETFPIKPYHMISIYDSQQWQVIIDAMVSVVHGARGTARRSGLNAGYKIAGKTGTAQVIGVAQDEVYKKEEIPEELRDHALFIAFAPAESPRIAIAIIVENGGSGSRSAAPIARRLFDHYLLNTIETG